MLAVFKAAGDSLYSSAVCLSSFGESAAGLLARGEQRGLASARREKESSVSC